MTDKQKCYCNVKTFDEKKLSKKTKVEKKPKPIKKISDKKSKEIKQRGSLDIFYQGLAKKHFDKQGNGECMYCGKHFNIKFDCINQRTCFAHILDKGDVKFKHLVKFKNNIAIVCGEKCHKEMDSEICTLILKPTLMKLIEKGEQIIVSDLVKYVN